MGRKSFATILVVLAMMLGVDADAQVKFGLKAGINATDMKFNTSVFKADNRIGFFAGPTVKFTLPIVGLNVDASALYDQREAKTEDEKLTSKSEEEKMALSSLILERYANAVVASKSVLTANDAKHKAVKMLQEVGIKDAEKRYAQYPFELSGGMRQRIVIAIALCSSPEILICDEPTTALDVTIQSQILELINKLKEEKNLSIVFITHDLGVVANMADDIAVMYAGKIVEQGTAEDIFYDPRHPYTWALLGSVPDLETKEKLNAIPGTPPNMLIPAKGDAFTPRNVNALEVDSLYQPPFFDISETHKVATWNVDERAPEIRAPEIVVKRIAAALKEHPEFAPKANNMKNSILNYIKEVK